MTEQTGIGIDQEAVEMFTGCLVDYYNFLLTGKGFEEFVTRSVILKETGKIGETVKMTDVLIAISLFHVNTILDLEQKLKMTPEQVADIRGRSAKAFEAMLNTEMP